MIKKIWLPLVLLLLYSCGARNSRVNTREKKTDSTSISDINRKGDYKIKEETFEIKDWANEKFNFEVLPSENDTVIVTNIVKIRDKKGNVIEVPYSSNSTFKYNSESNTQKSELRQKKEIDSLIKVNSSILNKISKFDKLKEKKTEKKELSLLSQSVLIIAFIGIIVLIWEIFKKKTPFL